MDVNSFVKKFLGNSKGPESSVFHKYRFILLV
ncbi:hypothetical protein [Escherichia phage KK4]|nr:hypothetical protein [Escherichia phage GADU22]WMM91746.1 hypothetical protein [Escherichia phage KK4]